MHDLSPALRRFILFSGRKNGDYTEEWSLPAMIHSRTLVSLAPLFVLLILAAFLIASLADKPLGKPATPTPEERAIAYLASEVPRWKRENHCYSCHNNGDGARALLLAQQHGAGGLTASLEDTCHWLEQPQNWDHNGGEGGFSDKVLAHIQFARALADTRARSDSVAAEAARVVAADQQPEGFWRIDAGSVGSPCTYGNALATAQACQALRKLAPNQESAAIARAERWLASQPRTSLLDNVAVLFGLNDGHDEVRGSACAAIASSQNRDGGWGPFATSGSEPFDTAIAILGLASQPQESAFLPTIERGRRFLLTNQLEDGSWIETTRPPGAVSYAQRLSTAGWATLALLATRNQQVCR
jgi:Prenyltransferase and squalene oxidase repeat